MKVEFRCKRDPLSTTAGPKAKNPKLEQPIPAGEDSTSFSRHNKLLLSESTKAHPNKAVVSEAMKLSFAMRRNDVVANVQGIPYLLAKYPFLGDKDEVKMLIYYTLFYCLGLYKYTRLYMYHKTLALSPNFQLIPELSRILKAPATLSNYNADWTTALFV